MADGLLAALRLVFITPGDRSPADTVALAASALAGGATTILVREPQLSVADRRVLAMQIANAARARGALLAIHGDVDLARAVGADAVHAGHGGPTVDAIRAARLVAGRSAHWPLAVEDLAADYVTLSPFAATPRSHPRPLLTGAQVDAVLATRALGPVVALGGVRAEVVERLPRRLAGVAVIRAIAGAPDPTAAARELRAAAEARFPNHSALA